jgi:hypothetical protein
MPSTRGRLRRSGCPGPIKHVALVEQQWTRFIIEGPSAMS